MKYLVVALLALVAVASAEHRAKRQGGNNPCRTCEQILNIAENHFHRNITDEAALQAQLQQECARIGQVEGDQAGQDCLNLVNNNIDTIYNDLHAGKRPRQTCQDIGACQAFTGRPTGASVAPARRVKRQGGNNICRTCEQILNIAENHFHNNITDKNALLAQLQNECSRLGQIEGPQAAQDCTNLVDTDIDKIFADLQAGQRPRSTCQDIGACQVFTRPPTGASAAPRRVKRQGDPGPCRTCEQILNIAENHFHRNISDQASLLAQLQQECTRIGQIEGDQAAADCNNIVNNNIDTIYADLHAGKRPRQTCEDIGACQAFTRPTGAFTRPTFAAPVERVKRQGGNNPCRTCEQILNIAENHFHRNITDEAALQAQLQQECARIGQVEGDQAGQDCLNLVNNNIDTIYNDLHAGKRPRQTCQDIGACQAFTGRPTGASVAPVRRVKRQGGNNPCRTCEQILNIAENHFHRNITDEAALQAQLQQECARIGQVEGDQAGQDCLNLVNNNIDTIYNDLHAGKRPRQTCQDIGACQAFTGRPTGASVAPVRRVKRQGGNNHCRTCEQILNIAENHFHRNITDEAALQAQLQQECSRIGQVEGQQAGQDCTNLVNTNIDTIYNDLHAGKRPRQTCEDIGQCQAFTRPPTTPAAGVVNRRH